MSNAVQFTAEFTKLTLAAKNKIELVLPEGVSFEKIAEIAAHKGEKINILFGSPQMAMSIAPAPSGRGLVATVDQSGVVQSTHRDDDYTEQDDDPDLFEQDGRDYTNKEIVIKGLDESTEYVFQIDDGEATHPYKWVNGERVLGMNVREVKDEIGPLPIAKDGPTRYMIEELLTAFNGELRDIAPENVEDADELPEPSDEEVSFEDGDAAEHAEESEEDSTEESEEESELDAEALESYILAEEPAFEQIPFNFPEMIRRIRESDGVRWMDIAKETGIPSTKLQAIYRKYKELVVEQMRAQGVA